ncbi:hypothetical protein OROMI_003673 [Orobanche minor]
METGIVNSSEPSNRTQSLSPLQEQSLQERDSWENLVQSIPNISAINIKCAPYMPVEGKKNLFGSSTLPTLGYKKLHVETSNTIRNCTLTLNKPAEAIQNDISTSQRTAKLRDHIPQTPERTLDDDYCLNLLDWGRSNILSIALGNTVYLWDASDGSTSVLVTIGPREGSRDQCQICF